ncbi:uncharacterized protein [Glycine max]|uniref:uncharacterized protein isoform X1 n=1 Tax=Glycine max TaxID=3847 RepID=UPI001B356EEC|nr:uncharacterized protein LOC102669179 isoform X1 [Glycine max]
MNKMQELVQMECSRWASKGLNIKYELQLGMTRMQEMSLITISLWNKKWGLALTPSLASTGDHEDGPTQQKIHAIDVSKEEVDGKICSDEVPATIGAGDLDGGDCFSHKTICNARDFVGGISTLSNP